MKIVNVRIGEKEYPFGYSLRSMFLFEQLAGHAFGIKTMQDEFLYFFCGFMIADSDFMGNDFKAYIDALDEHPEAIGSIREALNKLTANEVTEEADNGSKKKD